MKLMEDYNEKEFTQVANKRRLSKKMVKLLVTGACILLVIIALWVSWHIQSKQKAEIERLEAAIQELADTPMVANAVSPEIILDIVNSDIKKIGELATVEYLFTDSAKFSDSKQIKEWNIPLTEKSFILKWNGVIKAGVNIENIDVKVKKDDGVIVISMPDAEILSYSVDNDSVEVLDQKDNIFNKITIDDKVEFDASAEKEMKERAVENGLLEKAQKNAEELIENLLMTNSAICNDYEVEFVPAS